MTTASPPSADHAADLPAPRLVRVWDLPTRLFHWTLVGCVAFLLISPNFSLLWHMRVGQVVLALVLYRLVWGIIGSQTARFAAFVAGPKAAIAHVLELLAMIRQGPAAHRHRLGHTPLGGLMILALLGGLLLQAGTGLFVSDDIFYDGPLVHLVTGKTVKLLTFVHKVNGSVLMVCIAIHISAALFYLIRAKDNLIRPMLTGWVAWRGPVPSLLVRPLWLAALTLLLAAGAVAVLVRL